MTILLLEDQRKCKYAKQNKTKQTKKGRKEQQKEL